MFLKSATIKREIIPNYEEYPFSIPFVRALDELDLDTPITFFVGENGAGKSTLLEAIADQIGFNPAGGARKTIECLTFINLKPRLANMSSLRGGKSDERLFLTRGNVLSICLTCG